MSTNIHRSSLLFHLILIRSARDKTQLHQISVNDDQLSVQKLHQVLITT